MTAYSQTINEERGSRKLVIIMCSSVDQCNYVVGFSVKCVTPGHKHYSIPTDRGSHCSRSLKKLSILVKPAFYNQDEIGLRDHLGFFLTKRVIEWMHPISHLGVCRFPCSSSKLFNWDYPERRHYPNKAVKMLKTLKTCLICKTTTNSFAGAVDRWTTTSCPSP